MELKEGSGINNLEGLTDKETALVGASMYLHFNSDEEIEALQMDDKEFEDFYDDGYDNAGGKPFALGRGRKRGRGRFGYADGNSDGRDSVNGDWNSEVFGFTEEYDEEFDNLFTKRGRKKLAKGFKKVTKKIGSGIKKAGKKVGKAVKKGIKAVGKGIKAVGRFIVKGTMAIPRGAYLLLMRLNYRGLAQKTAMAKDNPKYKSKWSSVIKKWRKIGGSKGALEKAVNKGKNKKPFFCGKKCKSKLAKKVGKSFTGADGSQVYELDKTRLNRELMKMYEQSMSGEDESNFVVSASTGVAIGSATAIIGTMAGILQGVKNGKVQEKALKDAQKETERNNKEFEKQSSQRQKEEVRLAEEQIKAQTNPKNAIMNNPALSTAEKKEALGVLNDALAKESDIKDKPKKKWLLIAGIGVVALLGGIFLMKK